VDQDSYLADNFRLQRLQILSIREADKWERKSPGWTARVALTLVSIGLFSLVLATLEHRQNIRLLGEQSGGRMRSMAVVMAALISVLGILALVVMIFRQ
jgi:uncharacterized membrane protein YidH (DUF202 family)